MNWPPQKQHWVQRRKQGIAALGSPGTSQIHAFLAGVYPPTPRPNTSLMMATMMMRLVMVVHATTMSLVNSNFHLQGGQRQPPQSAWASQNRWTSSRNNKLSSARTNHEDEPQSDKLITALYRSQHQTDHTLTYPAHVPHPSFLFLR